MSLGQRLLRVPLAGHTTTANMIEHAGEVNRGLDTDSMRNLRIFQIVICWRSDLQE